MKSQEETVLFVNPVRRKSAQGRHLRSYQVLDSSTGSITESKLKHTTREDNVTSSYGFLINPETNRLETGLDELIHNPFKGEDSEDLMSRYNLPKDWREILPALITKDKITKQSYFEILAGTQPDFYTSEIKGGTIFNLTPLTRVTDDVNFLQKFKFTLYDRPNRFDTSTPRGRLCIEAIKKNPKIANNDGLVNTALHDWYISEENEAEQTYNRKQKIIKKGMYQLQKLELESDAMTRYRVATLLKDKQGVPVIKGEINADKVEAVMNQYIDSKNPYQLENIDKFLDIVNLLETPEGLDKFHIMAVLQQALNTNVIIARDGQFKWLSKSDIPNLNKFTDYDKMVNFFKKEYISYDPDETEINNWYKILIDEIKAKDGVIAND